MVVILVDELADLMMVTGKKVEELITRLAKRAPPDCIWCWRRSDHRWMSSPASSRPIFRTRIGFQVPSRVIRAPFSTRWAPSSCWGSGDMLFLQPGQGVPVRVHGAFVADHEVHKVVSFLKKTGRPV